MAIVEPVIRPPAEAYSFLLQVTLGCSATRCNFCGAYRNKPFGIKNLKEILADIEHQANNCKDIRRIFLLDGDALAMNNSKLLPILKVLIKTFPRLSRVSSYANGYNITQRDYTELVELYEHRLRLIYMGLESGSQNILNYHRKSSTVKEMIAAVNNASQAQIKSSVIVLLGLGGRKYSQEHVQSTIEALNAMQPRYLSFLSLITIPGTPLSKKIENNEFEELTSQELLKESYEIIKGVELTKTIFRSNHASNYLPLEGSFPKDKTKLLNTLKSAINGNLNLRPEFLRGL